jgi:hypothetical protein
LFGSDFGLACKTLIRRRYRAKTLSNILESEKPRLPRLMRSCKPENRTSELFAKWNTHRDVIVYKTACDRLEDLKKAGADPEIGLRHHVRLDEKDPPHIATGAGSVTNLPTKRKKSSSEGKKSRAKTEKKALPDYRGPKV